MKNVTRAVLLVVLPCFLLFIPQFVGAQDTIVWSADIDVSDYAGGSFVTTSFSNVGGSESVVATSLWYASSVKRLRLKFSAAPNRQGLTLHLGDLALPVSESSVSGKSWTWTNIDPPDWAGLETVQLRLVRREANTATPTGTTTRLPIVAIVSSDATDTATPVLLLQQLNPSTNTPDSNCDPYGHA